MDRKLFQQFIFENFKITESIILDRYIALQLEVRKCRKEIAVPFKSIFLSEQPIYMLKCQALLLSFVS